MPVAGVEFNSRSLVPPLQLSPESADNESRRLFRARFPLE
jgi:hypothetical protein